MFDHQGQDHHAIINPYYERGPRGYDADLVDPQSGATLAELYANREAPTRDWAHGSGGMLLPADHLYVRGNGGGHVQTTGDTVEVPLEVTLTVSVYVNGEEVASETACGFDPSITLPYELD
jgi:hypothetical protein